MSKVIKYTLCTVVNYNSEKPTTVEDTQHRHECVAEEVFTSIILPWSEDNEKLAQKEAHNGVYTIEDDGREESAPERIRKLKKQLSATDYKVIKCAECQLLGQEMPYDVAVLHAQRQEIRDEINTLEEQQ